MVIGEENISTSVWQFAPEELNFMSGKQKHGREIKLADFITWNIDHKQMGVGGDNAWGARPHRQYTIYPKPQSYKFKIVPLFGDENLNSVARKNYFVE